MSDATPNDATPQDATPPPGPAAGGFDPAADEAPLCRGCADWTRFVHEAPELAAAVQARFAATKHHVLATLRRDGSPRVSGTEVIMDEGVLAIGSMWQAAKAHDVRHDGRFALHANPGDGSMQGGDAKLAGVAIELHGELAARLAAGLSQEADEGERQEVPEPFHLFRLDLSQAVLTEVDHERNCLVIRTWRPGHEVVVAER